MIYLASLYSLGCEGNSDADYQLRQKRADYTIKRLSDFMSKGEKVFSPIAHCHEASKRGNLPKDYSFWKENDRHFIDLADEVWVLKMGDDKGSWEHSKGITDEIWYAKTTNTPIKYIDCKDYGLKGETLQVRGESLIKFKNTKEMQIIDLIDFASDLNYSWDGKVFSNDNGCGSSMNKISFTKMRDFYNNELSPRYGFSNLQVQLEKYRSRLPFSKESIEKALSEKRFANVKLQYSKKKGIIVQDHQVRFLWK